jgi:NAD(P)-dependent dehydrogenase (short-subunit alcohol dehydrogenase family)
LIPEDGFERTIFLPVAVALMNGRVPAVNVHPTVPQHSLVVIQHLSDKE